MRIALVFISGIIILAACKKPENRSCFKSWGTETSREIILPNFHGLFLKEHMEFVLIQDTLNKVVVFGGKNMVNLIKAEVDSDGILKITNENKCRFLRNKKKVIKVEIHFTTLDDIHFEGTEQLTNKGVLSIGYLDLFLRDGAGSVILNVNANVIKADVVAGSGDYMLSGSANYARISAKGSGYCDVTGLIIQDSIEVVSETVAPMKVNANGVKLYGYQKQDGNIYYKGTPSSISVLRFGSGQVLPM